VECLFETLMVGTVMEGDTLKGVYIESKSGREAILDKVVVDDEKNNKNKMKG
jgi:hypothetical protein